MSYSIYGRLNVPVWADTRTVLRALRRKLRRPVQRGRKHRNVRHQIYRTILKEHADAHALYSAVQSGRLS